MRGLRERIRDRIVSKRETETKKHREGGRETETERVRGRRERE